MKVLFDQNVPVNLARHLIGHEVKSAANMGWEELKNGDLIRAAEEGDFDVLVTCDQQWRYQQDLTKRQVAIVEVTVNNWPSVEPHVVRIADEINKCAPGDYRKVECAFVFRPRRRAGLSGLT